MSERDMSRVSRATSFLLRHGAIHEGLAIDDQGYMSTSTLLSHRKLKGVSLDTLKIMVDTDAKGRYNMVPISRNPNQDTLDTTLDTLGAKHGSEFKIRCNQGHSIPVHIL